LPAAQHNVKPHVFMLRALIAPRHAILAAVLAIGGASLVVSATEPSGDSSVAIAEVERKISAVDKVIKRYTYELRDATRRANRCITFYLPHDRAERRSFLL
jgi:hypothetical protein